MGGAGARDRLEGLRRQERQLRALPGAGRAGEMSLAAAEELARAAAESRRAGAGRPSGGIARLERAMRAVNRAIVVPCMLALLVAAALLTAGVVARYFLHAPTDWQEETSVLLLVGATFLGGPYVQEHRGHVAIEVLSSVLPPRLNRVRRFV